MLNKIKQLFRRPKVITEDSFAKAYDKAKSGDVIDLTAIQSNKDIIDLTRLNLKGITVDFDGMIKSSVGGVIEYNDITDGMTAMDAKDFIADVTRLNNGTLRKIVTYLINIQGNMSLREAKNETQRYFNLATINGIELLLETIDSLANKPDEPEEKLTDEEAREII